MLVSIRGSPVSTVSSLRGDSSVRVIFCDAAAGYRTLVPPASGRGRIECLGPGERSMAIAPETLIVVVLVIFVGYTIFGATGFGASPLTIPVLAHVLPLTFVLALAAVLDLTSGLTLGFHTRRQADTRELFMLLPFTVVGLTLGVTLLVKLPRQATVLALGVFVCVYGLHVILRRRP